MISVVSHLPEELAQLRAQQLGLGDVSNLVDHNGEFIPYREIAPAINDLSRGLGEYDGIIIDASGEVKMMTLGIFSDQDLSIRFRQLALTFEESNRALQIVGYDHNCPVQKSNSFLRRPDFRSRYNKVEEDILSSSRFYRFQMSLRTSKGLLGSKFFEIGFIGLKDPDSDLCTAVRGYKLKSN